MQIGSWPGYASSHNPFMKIFLDGLAVKGADIVSLESVDDLCNTEVNVVLLHWAETILWQSRSRKDRWRNMKKIIQFLSKPKSKRPKLIWVAHNLKPHKMGRLQKWIWWPLYMFFFVRAVDGVLTLSPGTKDVVRQTFPAFRNKPMSFFWHPPYPKPKISRQAARDKLGLPEDVRVLGYCGQIRKYKNLMEAISAFSATQDPDLRFLLAGKPTDRDLVAELEHYSERDPRIVLKMEDLSKTDFETALAACDTAVLPFSDYLHSGSMVHALSAGSHVLTRDTPFSRSLAEAVPASQITLYSEQLDPEKLLESAAAPVRNQIEAPCLPDCSSDRVLTFIKSMTGGERIMAHERRADRRDLTSTLGEPDASGVV